jgi:imidazolonepropionase
MSLGDLCRIGIARANQALLTGTTVIEAKSGYGLETEAELRLLEAMKIINDSSIVKLLPTWLGAHDFPQGRQRSEYLEELVSSQLPAVADQGIAKWVDVFCEEGWYTNDETENIVRASKEHGMPSRLHVDEFEDSGGLALAAELGSVSGDHVARSSMESRQVASDNGTMQTFLPGTPYVLGNPLDSPLSQCIENNWAFSLATDYNPNCRILSMPFIGNLATTRMGLDPFAALVAATRNPSTTLDDPSITGTIVESCRADLNILWSQSVDGWCQTPGENPIVTTIIGGSIVNLDK